MVDFDRLNAMIDEVNNVINDVEHETHKTYKATAIKETELLSIMWNDLKEYFKILLKCTCNRKFNIHFYVDNMVIDFVYDSTSLAFGTTKDFRIIDSNKHRWAYDIGMLGDMDYVYNRIKSCNTLPFIMLLAVDWENKYKDIFDNQIAIWAESLLKEKAEQAHVKYDKAKENAAKYEN